MKNPRIAIIAFPGNNGEVENLRTFWRNGFDAFVFRWNDSREKLVDADGYFIGAGFSYEDRGRAGMVAARDPLFTFLYEEAEKGKVIVGHCNGCQMLVESGLIPLGQGLRMSVAKNVLRCASRRAARHPEELEERSDESVSKERRAPQHDVFYSPGFLNEWIYIKRACTRDRCCTSDWEGVMQIPIAHGEGRFVTKDPDLIAALEENDQIAFRYCDAEGDVSEDPVVTPNGSTGAIAGICNPAGNVVAMMPHPERTVNGDPYFQSMKKWMCHAEDARSVSQCVSSFERPQDDTLRLRKPKSLEIFIDTIIVNNEERTVEQAARRISSNLTLKQLRYLAPTEKKAEEVLTTIALFNPNKEVAYVRKGKDWFKWDADKKSLENAKNPLSDTTLLRRDEPDVEAQGLGKGSETGVCYAVSGASDADMGNTDLQEIFGNPHASVLERYE